MFDFQDANRENILIKMELDGPPGSGKSYTALKVACMIAEALNLGDVYLIDSENESSKKYVYNPRTGKGWKFKALYMPKNDYSPQRYMEAIHLAEKRGARIIVVDSISHAWAGVNGILEQVDQFTETAARKRDAKYGNSFADGWRKATPIQNEFVQTILASPAHIICTMRADPEWVMPEGKKSPEMVGLSPKQRKDIAFEFDIAVSMDNARAKVWKTRCEELREHKMGIFEKPGREFVDILLNWIATNDDAAPRQAAPQAKPAPQRQQPTAPPAPESSDDNEAAAAKALAMDLAHTALTATMDQLPDLLKRARALPPAVVSAGVTAVVARRFALANSEEAIAQAKEWATKLKMAPRWIESHVDARREQLRQMTDEQKAAAIDAGQA